MKKDNFELLKFKVLKRGVEVVYKELHGDSSPRHSIDDEKYPHPDLIDIITKFKEPMADVFGFPLDDVENKIHPTGISLHGSGNKKSFILTAKLETDFGTVAINTPRIPYLSEEYPWIEETTKDKGYIDQLKKEIYEYFEKGKCSQLPIPFKDENKEEE